MSWPMKIWTVGEIVGASDLNNNFDNLQTTYNSLFLRADGRLTLTSGLPVTTSDVTAAVNVYYTPNNRGALIALYDGTSRWNFYTLTEVALGLTSKIKGVMYDVFITQTSGTLAINSTAWKKVTATSSPTAGASKTINMTDTGDLAVGREVTVKDGSNSEITFVSAVVSNTSITVTNLVNGYTLPDIYGFNQRATALTTVNGVLVQSGATTKRYVGTVRITDVTGQTEDSTARRYVWNFYNRVERFMKAVDATDSWNYTTATWRAANNSVVDGIGRFSFVTGWAEDACSVEVHSLAYNDTLGSIYCASGVGINQTDTNSSNIYGANCGRAQGVAVAVDAHYRGVPPMGFTYAQRLEISQATSTTTWLGDIAVTYVQTGMVGRLMM